MSEELKQALKELRDSFQKVENILVSEDIYDLGESYPFVHSFDDVALEVDSWVDELINS